MNIIRPVWPAPPNILAMTTLRGWEGQSAPTGNEFMSQSPRLVSDLNLPANPYWLHQTHSTIALALDPAREYPEGDASFTDQPNQVCVVRTADCLPILLTDNQGSEVAAIHAGWRGLAKGIIAETVNRMKAHPKQLLAWLGPAISETHFEVGAEVYQAFTEKNSTTASAFKPTSATKWHANLYLLAKIHLQTLGIQQIYGGNFCTYTDQTLFYSYRREGNQTGRMATLIWLTPK